MLADAEVRPGEGDAVVDGGQFLDVRFHEFDPVHEAGGVGDLDGETRAGVEFQEQGPQVLVQDQVHPQVAQPGEFLTPGRDVKQSLPVGIDEPLDAVAGVGVLVDDLMAADPLEGGAGGQVDAGPDGPLVEVGLAPGGAGWAASAWPSPGPPGK